MYNVQFAIYNIKQCNVQYEKYNVQLSMNNVQCYNIHSAVYSLQFIVCNGPEYPRCIFS